MKELGLEKAVLKAISETPVGGKVEIRFSGLPIPIEISMKFSGGWEVYYTLIPGKPLEFLRGENNHLEKLNITFMPHDGLK